MGKEPKVGIKENVSAVLRNEKTGRKIVIRKRRWWEKIIGRRC